MNNSDIISDIEQVIEVEEGQGEWISMVPVYKNKDKSTSTVILQVSSKEIPDIRRSISNSLIPDLSSYKKQTSYGYGIEVFQADAIDYYDTYRKYPYLKIIIDSSNILNITTVKGYHRLLVVYEEMVSRGISCKSDVDLFNFLVKQSLEKYSGVMGLMVGDSSLFIGSNIHKYMGTTITIYDTSIIKNIEIIEKQIK